MTAPCCGAPQGPGVDSPTRHRVPSRADLRDGGSFAGSFASEIAGETSEPPFDARGEWCEDLKKPIGVAFVEEPSPHRSRFPLGSISVQRRLANSASLSKAGDYLVELNGEDMTQTSFKEAMSILRRLPVGVACSYIFHRPGAEAPVSTNIEGLMLMGGMTGGLNRGSPGDPEEEDLVEGYPGWTQKKDPDSRVFYIHRESGTTQWHHPGELAPSPATYAETMSEEAEFETPKGADVRPDGGQVYYDAEQGQRGSQTGFTSLGSPACVHGEAMDSMTADELWQQELARIATTPRQSPYSSPRSSLRSMIKPGGSAASSPRHSVTSMEDNASIRSAAKVAAATAAQKRLDERVQEMARQRHVILGASPRSSRGLPQYSRVVDSGERDSVVSPSSLVPRKSSNLKLDGTGQISRSLPPPERKLPKLEGWLEKKGQVFWNMRYFVLEDNVLRYFDKAIIPGAAEQQPHAVIDLEGCEVTLQSGILTVKTGTGGMLGAPSFRMKHRDTSSITQWHTTIALSQEIFDEAKAHQNRYRG